MRRIWALVVALLVAANAQAISAPVPMPSPDSATFGVTVPAQAFFLRRLLGAGVKVEVLLPPGVNHETFEPSLGQLTRLQKAGGKLTGFARFHLGEGIQKETGDFAAEVAAMSKS